MMEILKILNTLQTELKAPKGQFNKFGGYSYRSCEDILEAVKPLLKKTGAVITVSDEITAIANRVYVKATATLRYGEETLENSAYAREAETKKGMDESQVTGAASSYARKYALNGLLCIDDNKDADATNTHGKDEETPLPAKKQKPVEKKAEPETPECLLKLQAFREKIKNVPDLSIDLTKKENIAKVQFVNSLKDELKKAGYDDAADLLEKEFNNKCIAGAK